MKSAYALLAHLDDVKDNRPPIDLWHPETVTDSRMRIDAAGEWFHDGDPVERIRLVRLFASILRRESDGSYYLITPAEKAWVEVEDVPFLIVAMSVTGVGAGQTISVTSNMAETVSVGAAHPLEFRAGRQAEPLPYVRLRDGLDAIFARPVYYELMELAETANVAGVPWFVIRSAGETFTIMRAESPDDE